MDFTFLKPDMPPKGAKVRRAGNPAGNNSGTKIETPANESPKSEHEPSPQRSSPTLGISEGEDSDFSDFNEGDSLKMLKKNLINQKVAEKKSDERFAKLNKAIKDSKKSLDSYKTTNDLAVAEIKTSTENTAKELLDLKEKVNDLQVNLDSTQNKLDDAKQMLNDTVQDLKVKAKTIEKLEKKYEKDEEDLKRSLLLMDGVNERDHKKPITVIQALLTELEIPYKDGDIKAAYRIGALKNGVSRPRTIKIQFSNTSLKGQIFKNISKLKKSENWKGVHLNDALSPKELQQAKYCIYGMKSIVKKSSQQDMIISLSNTVLEKVCSYKYLGFILDDQLNFNKHVKELVKLITHKLYLLSRIRKYLTKNASITIFKTMILSLIEYGDIIYAGTNQTNLNKIVNLFYRGLRICDNTNNKITKETLCEDCHIAPLDVRREIHLLLFMHKQTCSDYLLKKPKIQTRLHQAPVFKLCKPNNEKVKQNILYRGAISWNSLPAHDRNKTFKDLKNSLCLKQFL